MIDTDFGTVPEIPEISAKHFMSLRDKLYFAVIISFCTVGLILVVALLWDTFLSDPPVRVTSLNPHLTEPVCPGTQVPVRNRITVTEPTILLIYISVMDEGNNFNIPGTVRTLEPRLHPHPSSFDQVIPWSIPILEPGNYVRTVAFRGHDPEQKPFFVYMKFTVPEGCFR